MAAPIVGAGGAPNGSGGSVIAAGSSGSAPAAADAGGCSCSLPRRSARGGALSLVLAALFGLASVSRAATAERRRRRGMTLRLATVGIALAGLLASNPAAALQITIAPSQPAPVGQAQTFKIATVADSTGTRAVPLELRRWDGHRSGGRYRSHAHLPDARPLHDHRARRPTMQRAPARCSCKPRLIL